jgi:hypothetical protein
VSTLFLNGHLDLIDIMVNDVAVLGYEAVFLLGKIVAADGMKLIPLAGMRDGLTMRNTCSML